MTNPYWKSRLIRFAGVLVVILVVILVLASPFKSSGPGRAGIRSALEAHVDNLNRSLPMMLDKDTQFDSAEINAGGLIYRYTALNLTGADVDRAEFKRLMEPGLLQSTCANAEARNFIDNDFPFSYAYFGQDGQRFATITITADKCKEWPP